MWITLKLNRLAIKVVSILVVGLFFMSCNSYKDPVSFDQAVNAKMEGYVKVTYNNDEQDVFERLEVENGVVYGINSKKNDIPKTELKKEEIAQIEEQDKKVSNKNTVLGVLLAALGVYLIATMF